MIYAKEENGVVKETSIPNIYNNIIGFKYANKDVLEANGFFEIIVPALDIDSQLGALIKVDGENKYTYEIVKKTSNISKLEERRRKSQQIIDNELLGLIDSNRTAAEAEEILGFLEKVIKYFSMGLYELSLDLLKNTAPTPNVTQEYLDKLTQVITALLDEEV